MNVGKPLPEELDYEIIKLIKDILPQTVVENISGMESDDLVEIVNTGSTGRGTGVPGDSDFDYMLISPDEKTQLQLVKYIREYMSENLSGKNIGGTNARMIRYSICLDGYSEPVSVDIYK